MLRGGDDCAFAGAAGLLWEAVAAAPPFFKAAAAPVAETDDTTWPNAADATRDATTTKDLMERSTGMGETCLGGIVAAYHGKLQSVIHHVRRSSLVGRAISIHEATALYHGQKPAPCRSKQRFDLLQPLICDTGNQLNNGAGWSPAAAAYRPFGGSPACSAARGFRADEWRIRQ